MKDCEVDLDPETFLRKAGEQMGPDDNQLLHSQDDDQQNIAVIKKVAVTPDTAADDKTPCKETTNPDNKLIAPEK